MAKKQKAEVAVEEPVMVAPLEQKEKPKKKNTWEYKDRQYYLLSQKSPVVFILKSKGIMWFDENAGFEREIKYTLNQKTPFVDEFKGDSRLDHIIFRDGVINVPKERVVLQQILSIYHPDLNKRYAEVDNEAAAKSDLDELNLEFEAMEAAMSIEIDHAEAIVRTERGGAVSKMSSQEIKRDLFLMAKQQPELFLELANDENINIRNMGIKAVEMGLMKLSSDQRTFMWASNNRKLFTVPFDENPYSALTSWFKTDEGVEVYQVIEKKLK
mgnify:FL=1|tara:strand:- start:491 stop:1300 length:810 start_codon:yes stop_codon:yes gene_type:complete